MKRSFPTCRAAACAIATAAFSLYGIASAQTTVALGTDYLETAQGTQFVTPFGPIALQGVPISQKYGMADTIVERQENADLTNPMPIPIQLMKLSLQSINPIQVNGVACNVSVGLDRANLDKDTGTMTIMANITDVFAGGTFDSMLNVYYEAKFTPATGTGSCPKPIKGVTNLAQNGGTWQPKPVPAQVIVKAPATCVPTVPPTVGHCLSTPAQTANTHTKLPPATTDFYIKGNGGHVAPSHSHNVCEAPLTRPDPCP
jgi:hypothetical protein